MEKIMRMHSVTSTIENGFVHLPEKSEWLAEYLHEIATFPKGKYDDQADSTSQALDWFKNNSMSQTLGLIEYWKKETKATKPNQHPKSMPDSMPCTTCQGVMRQRIPSGLRCMQCGAQWLHPDAQPRIHSLTRADVLIGMTRFR
jgi:hypothetical protein